MNNRFFSRFLFHMYPGAIEIRSHIQSLPTSQARIMAIQGLDHIMINAVCALILADLRPSTNSIESFRLTGLDMHLNHEYSLRFRMEEGLLNLMGTKADAGITVNMLRKVANKFQLSDISEAARPLWQELSDWFCGKYEALASKTGRRVIRHNLITGYPFVDLNDRLFWLFTNIKQLDLAMPYYKIAGIINQRISILYPPVPSAPPADIELLTPPADIAPLAPPLTEGEISETSESSKRPEFECPLTLTMMKAAAICLRDGCSYEAAILQQTIEKFGITPSNIKVDKNDLPNLMLLNLNPKSIIAK